MEMTSVEASVGVTINQLPKLIIVVDIKGCLFVQIQASRREYIIKI